MTATQRPAKTKERRDSFRQRLWSAMRIERTFGRSDLVRLAARVSEFDGAAPAGVNRSTREYLTALHRAGYLRVLRRGKGVGAGGVETRYLLFRDTGPLSPRYGKRRGIVTDPNTGDEYSSRPTQNREAS